MKVNVNNIYIFIELNCLNMRKVASLPARKFLVAAYDKVALHFTQTHLICNARESIVATPELTVISDRTEEANNGARSATIFRHFPTSPFATQLRTRRIPEQRRAPEC